MGPPRTQEEGFEQTVEMLTQHAKIADMIHQKFGVEEEDFTKAMQQNNLFNDPEVINIMKSSLKDLPPEVLAQAAQAFGQGMPPGGMQGGGMPGGGMGQPGMM